MRDEIDFSSGPRGIPLSDPSSSLAVSVILDDDVRLWLLERAGPAGDAGLGAMINVALREHMRRPSEPLERTLRRVLREELRKAG